MMKLSTPSNLTVVYQMVNMATLALSRAKPLLLPSAGNSTGSSAGNEDLYIFISSKLSGNGAIINNTPDIPRADTGIALSNWNSLSLNKSNRRHSN